MNLKECILREIGGAISACVIVTTEVRFIDISHDI